MVFTIVTLAWVFFRAPDIHTAFDMIWHSLQLDKSTLGMAFLAGKTYTLAILFAFIAFEYVIKDVGFNEHVNARPLPYRLSLYSLLLIFILYFGVLDDTSFIYFQF